MRIAFVVWRFPVLSEPFILNQIAGLLDRGHDVRIFALNGAPEATGKAHDLVARHGMMERASLVAPLPETGGAAAVARRLAGPALRHPVMALRLMAQVLSGGVASPLKMLNRAATLMDAGRFDIVHCQFGSLAPPVLAFRRAGLLQGRLVTHFRGIDISSYVVEHGRDVYDRVFAESDYFLANCAFFRDKAIALGCPPERIASHGSGIDLAAFPFRMPPPVEDGVATLISAGRLVEKKGLAHAIRAVGRLTAGGRRVRYRIIGDGPERARLEALIAELGLGESVQLLGWRTHTEMARLLASA
ncbi:MAG: glycosyltransferase, partial [Pseudomonadota bacterium]